MILREIYLDNSATTRVDDDTAAIAVELMTGEYGNPSSLHSKGLRAQERMDAARRQLAEALGCTREEVVFTSGGTEANNLALLGGAEAMRRRGNTLVAMAWEHSSVLEPLCALEKQGFTLRLVNPGPDGRVDLDALLAAVDGDTVLVSCMLVNSEVGAVAPVADLVRGVRGKNKLALIHCDAVQAFCKLPFSATKLGVDLATISAHKLHAPKGAGALYIRRGVRILPRTFGGSQENGLRPGTENVAFCCAFGHAAEKQVRQREAGLAHVGMLREHFVNKACGMAGVCINSPADATPYICNLSVPGYRSEILLHYLAERGIYISSGSACAKGARSHVLESMGLPRERTDSALRISFCAGNTTEEIDLFFAALEGAMREVMTAN